MRREELALIRKKLQKHEIAQLPIMIDGKEYVRVFRPQERLLLFGAGHVARPTCKIASLLGYNVVVIDDREEFANATYFPEAKEIVCAPLEQAIEQVRPNALDYIVIMTRGHMYDRDCLKEILSITMPFYLGVMGSKRKTAHLMQYLTEEGFGQENLDQIHMPIGFDIAAITPEEIAVSVAAELVSCRRKKNPKRSLYDIEIKNTEEPSPIFLKEEFYRPSVLDALIDGEKKAVWILVYETKGSTPAQSGLFMMLDEDGKCYGTIGGGSAEAQAIKEAFPYIGSGQSKTISISMNHMVAAEEGMVCGGESKLYIEGIE